MSKSTSNKADRREFVSKLLSAIPDALVVTGLGSASYDVFAAGDRDKNYYLWGAMGGSTSLGLGLALAQPDKPVVVIDDSGSLAAAAVRQLNEQGFTKAFSLRGGFRSWRAENLPVHKG